MRARQFTLLVLLAVAFGSAGCYRSVLVVHPPLFLEEDAVPLAPYLGQWRYVYPPEFVEWYEGELAEVTIDVQARVDACSVVVATVFGSSSQAEWQSTYGDTRLMRIGDKVLGVEENLGDDGELKWCYVFWVAFLDNDHRRLELRPMSSEFIQEKIRTGALEGKYTDVFRAPHVKLTTDATRFRQFLEENIGDQDMFPGITIVLERIPAQ